MPPVDFDSIPTRNNGDDIDADWFNILQQAGANLESQVNGTPTTFNFANNQASPADITFLTFDGGTFRSFEISYDIYVNTTGSGATELAESGKLMGVYSTVAGTWAMTQGMQVGATGVVFSITNAGQVQYTSPNFTGTVQTLRIHYRSTEMVLT